MSETVGHDAEPSLSPSLIALFRGVVYADAQPQLWQALLRWQARVRDHVAVLGLELMLDETEGCAYLRQRSFAEGEDELPRLVPRRQLSYPVSLLLALLRRKLAEHDASGGDLRLVLSRDEIVEAIRMFLPDTGDEAKLVQRIDTHINRVLELGFLRRLRGQEDRYEVRRIIKSFVDAQWLTEFNARLEEYRHHGSGESTAQKAGKASP
ncbi:MAG: DUF4194 domain-containing protein [Gammaproteobacteria bacterium]|nr:DUF4194 domain-containing protein [Gammaproteobacteria bacterium]TVQ50437.1 MAG: DUF4194 domain-containing protein [Gammaproteobacteria bacterium]